MQRYLLLILVNSWECFGFDMKVSSVDNCKPNMPIQIRAVMGENNFIKTAAINITTAVDDDPLEVTIKYSTNNKTFIKMGTIKESNSCRALNKYMGETWYNFQRAAHVAQVGYCPIKKAVYNYANYSVDLSQMPLQTFPKGYVIIIIRIFRKVTRAELVCFEFRAFNK